MDKTNIKKYLNYIMEVTNKAFPDPEDDEASMIWNACLGIAEEVGVELETE